MSRRRGRRRGQRPRVPLLRRLLRNRYRGDDSNWVSVADVVANLKETAYCWWNRVPAGSRLMWRNGRITGFIRPWNGPR